MTGRSLTPPSVRVSDAEIEAADLRVVSLGAGVQSTAVLLLALNGDIQADCAIFADTGWEPAAVYEHLQALQARCADAGFPLHVVTAGNLREDAVGEGRFASIPFFLRNPDGTEGMARRQCTNEYKITPVRRKVRELLGGKTRGHRTIVHMGISREESIRMRTSDVSYIRNSYPLIEREWSRQDCHAYLAEHDIEAPRSACIGCPFRSNREWKRLTPDEVADAADFEAKVQASNTRLAGTPWLHRERRPIDEVLTDMRERETNEPGLWDDECAGVCGV